MDPTAYMPFYGDDFFRAVKGHTEKVAMAYLNAIWHYWTHTKCSGLRNDSEFLRGVCEVDKSDWPSIYEIVFDNKEFFIMDGDGVWHQKRAFQEWRKSKEKYEKRLAQTAAATEARLKKYRQ